MAGFTGIRLAADETSLGSRTLQISTPRADQNPTPYLPALRSPRERNPFANTQWRPTQFGGAACAGEGLGGGAAASSTGVASSGGFVWGEGRGDW